MQNNVLSRLAFLEGIPMPADIRRNLKYLTVILSVVPSFFLIMLFIATFIPMVETVTAPLLIHTMNIMFVIQLVLRKVVNMPLSSKVFTLSVIAEILWLAALVN